MVDHLKRKNEKSFGKMRFGRTIEARQIGLKHSRVG
jgi:hypothetical protein